MRYKKYEKTILTDCDGVLLDWEWAFNCWMIQHGFETTEGYQFKYDMAERYGISKPQVQKLVKTFNESAAIGFLPVLRDAMYPNAGKLREMNLQKMFGKTAFSEVVCLDTGADKDEALSKYAGSDCWWIEDKVENATAGLRFGLKPILIEHGHNMNETVDYPIVKNWEELYRLVTKL